ncbi:polyphosphate kinase 2 [Fulvivirga sedimenti]|uniref:ADP/GDP-polyphosphate phosphotransferase n=1 Tax=Fulvivirga sedimenti TaxID=2879465 RepID=A0A9X1HPR5_9BACT|nr:polyphosphate kinase 2 [Fulvivirga sedimenti]MCA6074532.1 polyphosphate kinase 2 [Fulvivirga sedimenti]MCA6075709.1 polyphosphate kinase 2 [Fulvivirga sedimenti]MCA6076837.1 polyphosphate kinase 2 [Fulvivirga sedimenti]
MSQFILTDKALQNKLDPSQLLTAEDFKQLKDKDTLRKKLRDRKRDISKIEFNIHYEEQLRDLQIELVKLQAHVIANNLRVAIIFEGRDAAGKGGAIKRFAEHLNPRAMRVVALSKPTDLERKQWYFRRYIGVMPNAGEIVFFDRSWYNRAVVEPVMGFCNEDQYRQFMRQVPEFEHMLFEDGVIVIKFWFSITKEEQAKRFQARGKNPLKQWKLSPVDQKGQELWDKYTYYKDQMFSMTHTSFSPWIIVKTNKKKIARLESIRYVLSQFEYDGKSDTNALILPDPNLVNRYHRSVTSFDS